MEMKFLQTAEHFQGNLHSFQPYPQAALREAYENLPTKIKEDIISEGESYLHYSYPAICATDFMNFKRTGNRVAFEDIYFARRHALNGLVLAECVEHKGRFLDDIINGIFAICEESAWQLPPHNSYMRSEPQYILPDATRPVLDLFACETGAMLAYVAYLLQDELNAVSPFIVKRIQHELDTRIITPYLTWHFWWMGKEDEEMCNWTVWCTQNVLLTAFTIPFADNVRKEVFHKAAASCDYFLKDYGDDGCCDEGAQYYRHAGLCLFGAMNILDEISGGAFTSLYQWEKIKNIASYILNVHVDDKYYFNFADCSAIAGRSGAREYLFGKATKQAPLMQFAAKDFQADAKLYTDEVNRLNLYYRLQTIFTYEELMSVDASTPVFHKDIFYPSVGLFIVRSDNLSLAVKSGDNADSHNHNDTGSFTLYKNGQPVFVDIGVESYCEKTFSSHRYEIWTMQSGYHNLPTLNGLDEKDGKEYCATQVKASLEGEIPGIFMELACAYPFIENSTYNNTSGCGNVSPTPKAYSYTRHIELDKNENKVILCDQTNAEDVILNFITYDKPVIDEYATKDILNTPCSGSIKLGTQAVAHFEGARLLALETLPITDARLQKAWDHDLYRIRLRLIDTTFRMEIQ